MSTRATRVRFLGNNMQPQTPSHSIPICTAPAIVSFAKCH